MLEQRASWFASVGSYVRSGVSAFLLIRLTGAGAALQCARPLHQAFTLLETTVAPSGKQATGCHKLTEAVVGESRVMSHRSVTEPR